MWQTGQNEGVDDGLRGENTDMRGEKPLRRRRTTTENWSLLPIYSSVCAENRTADRKVAASFAWIGRVGQCPFLAASRRRGMHPLHSRCRPWLHGGGMPCRRGFSDAVRVPAVAQIKMRAVGQGCGHCQSIVCGVGRKRLPGRIRQVGGCGPSDRSAGGTAEGCRPAACPEDCIRRPLRRTNRRRMGRERPKGGRTNLSAADTLPTARS